MRNLLQYPITGDEVLREIEQIPWEPEQCGSLSGIIKQALANYFNNEERMNELLEQLRIRN